jgi:preprotein translocase subunit SecE
MGKKNNEFWNNFLMVLLFVLIACGCFALSAWIISAIVNSDLPLWLKVLLLR